MYLSAFDHFKNMTGDWHHSAANVIPPTSNACLCLGIFEKKHTLSRILRSHTLQHKVPNGRVYFEHEKGRWESGH